MKKIIPFLVFFALLVVNASASLSIYGEFDNHENSAIINFGESIHFDVVISSSSYPLSYSVRLISNNGQTIHTYSLNERANNFLVREYIASESEYHESGGYSILINAINSEGDSNSYILYLTVNQRQPQNNPPTINLWYPQNNAIGIYQSPTLVWNSNDMNNDALYHTVYLNNQIVPNWQNINQETCQLSNLNYNTQYSWKVQVSDGVDSITSSEWVFTTIEQPGEGHNPQINILTPAQGEIISGNYEITWLATDQDQQDRTLDVKIQLKYENLQFITLNEDDLVDNNDGSYIFDSLQWTNSPYILRLTVTDDSERSSSDEIVFEVNNRFNHAPQVELNHHPGEILTGDYLITWDSYDDEDISNLDVLLEIRDRNRGHWQTLLDSETNPEYYILRTSNYRNGNYDLKIVVRDQDYASSENYVGNVIIRNIVHTNNPPQLNILNPDNGEQISNIYAIVWDAIDLDQPSEDLRVKVEYAERNILGYLFNGYQTIYEGMNYPQRINFNTKNIENGNYKLRITIYDSEGLMDSEINDFSVLNLDDPTGVQPNLYPPQIVSEPSRYAYVNEMYEYQLEIVDIDREIRFFYNLIEFPEGMSIDNDGLISWTPLNTGDYNVKAEVSDGHNSDTQEYVIHVLKRESVRKIADIHKFILANAILRYDSNYIYIYPNLRNQGNQKEKVILEVSNLNTGDYITRGFNLDISEGGYSYIILPKPTPGVYVIRIEANNKDFSDIIYRTLEIV